MTKAREANAPSPIDITCPHCGVDLHPFAWFDDWLIAICGYCGKAIEIWRVGGESKVKKA